MKKSKKQNKKKPKNKSTLKNADKEVGYNKDERKDDSMENGDFKLKSPAKLNNMNFKPVEIIPDVLDKATGQDKTEEIIEEIADDMLHLMEKIKKIELKQDEQAEKIERLCQIIQETRQEHTIELDKLRRDLIEERKALSVRSVFNSILPTLDSLRIMRSGLSPQKNKRLHAQLNAVTSSLTNIIQGLGFIEFEVTEGSTFNPSLMECLGYSKGNPDCVVQIVRPGYKIKDTIIRPCGVIITKALKINNT